jgi:thiol-disulfide isomerase/thioredoxin
LLNSSTRATLQTFAVFIVLALVAAFAVQQLQRPQKAVPEGVRLTELDVVPLANGATPLAPADLAGKVVLINFWGTWCPPCLAEFPHMEALWNQYRDRKDFLLLSISTNSSIPEDMTRLREVTTGYLSLNSYKMPIYADPLGKTRLGLRDAVDPGVYPATVLIDRDGKAIAAWTGFREAEFDQIKLKVAELLAR